MFQPAVTFAPTPNLRLLPPAAEPIGASLSDEELAEALIDSDWLFDLDLEAEEAAAEEAAYEQALENRAWDRYCALKAEEAWSC